MKGLLLLLLHQGHNVHMKGWGVKEYHKRKFLSDEQKALCTEPTGGSRWRPSVEARGAAPTTFFDPLNHDTSPTELSPSSNFSGGR
jgi:hypothetical protein